MAASKLSSRLTAGLLVAATGIGAGDLVLSALAGAQHGVTLCWAIVLGAVLKYSLNEGLAKWEIATRTTLLEGWIERLPKIIVLYFGAYLVFWAYLVAATLITYTGQALNSIVPLPMPAAAGAAVWGALQSVSVAALIWFGGFRLVERAMKVFIVLMFFVIIAGAIMIRPDWGAVLQGLVVPRVSADPAALVSILALIGGVGGTLTIMCYSYWLREQRAAGTADLRTVRIDLGVAYFLKAVFGIAIMIIAAGVRPENVRGVKLVLTMADQLDLALGSFGKWSFLLGFWSAVLTSMIGVWHGVPYLFADFMQRYRARYLSDGSSSGPLSTSKHYRGFLLYLALPPILLAITGRPGWIGVAYALSGAFFMPFLAAIILYMNNRKAWVGKYRNGWLANLVLVVCLLLFMVLFLADTFGWTGS